MNAQTFFTKFKKLYASFPITESAIKSSENVQYSNFIYDSKNLTYCFDTAGSQDGLYLFDSFMCINCIDCDYTSEAEHNYECVDAFKCYNCDYLENCENMRDCSFCVNSGNLENCFGCVNLVNKSFCLFNRQLTESEYREQIKKYKEVPADRILAAVEELKLHFPAYPNVSGNSSNSPYDNHIFFSKNCYMCFSAAHNENCAYLHDSHYNKYSFDLTYASRYNEYSYQIIECARLNNCAYCIASSTARDSAYLINCNDVRDCFGCVGLKYKEYCVLNRQFTKEEYERILPALKKEVFESGIGWNDIVY